MKGMKMQTRQRGISIMGLMAALFIVIILAVFGMKLIPSFIEYRTARNGIEAISREKQGSSVADIRKAFEARATIDDITSVKPQDLEITKEGSEVVISFAYEKRIKLFYNISVLIDFAGSSRPASTKVSD